jgi:hypothetical protein
MRSRALFGIKVMFAIWGLIPFSIVTLGIVASTLSGRENPITGAVTFTVLFLMPMALGMALGGKRS